MDWRPISEWKQKIGQQFLFYYPAEAERKYRTIGLDAMYRANSGPCFGARNPTFFVEITPPDGAL